MVIAGDHENGDGGNYHHIKCQQGISCQRGAVFLINNQKDQHGKAGKNHHVQRHHVNYDHCIHYDILDQIKPIGHQKQDGRIKHDRKALPCEDALLGWHLIEPYVKNLIAKALEAGSRCVRDPKRCAPRDIGSVLLLSHLIPPFGQMTFFVCFGIILPCFRTMHKPLAKRQEKEKATLPPEKAGAKNAVQRCLGGVLRR